MTQILGSLQKVWKQPDVFRTVDNAPVVQVIGKKGRIRYKYENRRNAALRKFDTPMLTGDWAGYTPRQMFAETRSPAFRKGVRNFDSNCKKPKSRGMLARSSSKLRVAYHNKPVQSICQTARRLKPCSLPQVPVPCKSRKGRTAVAPPAPIRRISSSSSVVALPAPIRRMSSSVMAAVAAAPSVARRKVSRRTRVPSECNVIKTQSDCRDPCIWKTGKGGSQFCSKKGLSGAKRSAAADALLMLGR